MKPRREEPDALIGLVRVYGVSPGTWTEGAFAGIRFIFHMTDTKQYESARTAAF